MVLPAAAEAVVEEAIAVATAAEATAEVVVEGATAQEEAVAIIVGAGAVLPAGATGS